MTPAAPSAPLTGRDTTYDWLRLFATLCVIIGHSCYLTLSTKLGGISYTLPPAASPVMGSLPFTLLNYLSRFVYSFHMPLFFLLSGAVLALKPLPRFGSFLKSKAKRLLLPYFVWGLLFMFPLKYLGDFYSRESILPALLSFFLGGESGHLWFLFSLFWAMILFVLLIRLQPRGSAGWLLPLGLCALIHFGSRLLPWDFFSLKRGLENLFYLAAGYYFQTNFKGRNQISLPRALLFGGISLAAWMAAAVFIQNSGQIIRALLGSLSLYWLSYLCTKLFHKFEQTRLWSLLIPNLFYVYLLHDPLEYLILKVFMNSRLLEASWGCWLYLLLRTLGIFLVSLLLGQGITLVKNQLFAHREKKTA